MCCVGFLKKNKARKQSVTRSTGLAVVEDVLLAAFIAISESWKMQVVCVKLQEVLVLG